MRYYILLLLLLPSLYAQEQDQLASLLNTYQHEADLSKITKKEEAGVLDIYTRYDLETMQAKTFADVLKIIPGFHFTRTSNNLTSLIKPSFKTTQLNSIHLYINDHDMSSSSFGSAFLIWGELPIEYIDHIEVYKGAASIEFGNETSSVIIKLYTKDPRREEGGKVKLLADNLGSTNLDAYIASQENDFSYFAYANINNINRTKYYNEYEDKKYTFNSDRSGHNLYANLAYKKWNLELGSYKKKSNSFLGIGIYRTPTDGTLDTRHSYAHLTKKFENNIKLQLSYDDISYDRSYVDLNGIGIANAPLITDYTIHFDDAIFSAILEKKIIYNKHSFLVGGFAKRKTYKQHGNFYNEDTLYLHQNSSSNALNLYSMYAEYSYNYNITTRLIASIKGDFYNYDKAIPSNNEISAKLGCIKHIDNFHIKAFLTNTYSPAALYQLYNSDNIPYKTNPNLNNTHIIIATLSMKYKKDQHSFKVVLADNLIEDAIYYDPTLSYGFTNSDESTHFLYAEIDYTYQYDINNKLIINTYYGENTQNYVYSPKFTTTLQLFTKYKKFDIYNELIYKNAYTYLDINVDNSFDYTLALKYHTSKDLSFGFRGENLFHDSYKQVYRSLDYAIPVNDQKIWINMEYLF